MSPKPRLWPFYLMAIAYLGVLIYASFFGGETRQDNVMIVLTASFLLAFALPIWFLFLSRFTWRIKKMGILGSIAFVLVFFTVFEIREISGDFVPMLAFRWSQSYEDLAAEEVATDTPVALQTTENDYPRYLGPNGNNTLTGMSLAKDWDTNPPKERWRIEIGAAWSAFSVQGKLAVTQEQRGDKEMVSCYNLETGEVIWRHGDDNLYASTIGGNGPRATPNLYDGKVYTFGPTGILNCLNLADGSQVWEKDTVADNQGNMPEWGFASSPLVYGDTVVVVPGGEGNATVAYNRHDGARLWSAGNGRAGYATPALYTLGGKEQIVVFYHDSLASHDPATGAILWETPWGGGQPTAANPLPLDGERLLVSSGYGAGAALFKITGNEAGGLEMERLYETPRLKAKFANYVALGDYIYGLDEGVLTCMDPATGERVWKRGRYGHGQLLLVNNLLLVQSEKGGLYLVEPNPDAHRELGKIDVLSGKAWNNMALSGNLLLMRNHQEAVCLELPTR